MIYLVRIELEIDVEADSEDDAKYRAIDDLAFGRVSVAEALVTDIRERPRANPSVD